MSAQLTSSDVSGSIDNDVEVNSAKVNSREDGLGNLLFHMHSVHINSILFAKEETSLQFYEHVGEYTAFVVHVHQLRKTHCTYLNHPSYCNRYPPAVVLP